MRNGTTHCKSLLPLALALLVAGCGGGGGGGGSTLGSAIPATCSVSGGGGSGTGSVNVTGITYFKARSDAEANDAFGGTHTTTVKGDDTVSISDAGTAMVVGAPGAPAGSSQGEVHMYVDSSGWSGTDTVVATNPDNQDKFGASVAISGDGLTLAVGTRTRKAVVVALIRSRTTTF